MSDWGSKEAGVDAILTVGGVEPVSKGPYWPPAPPP
jgi:hypothetical protein